MSYLIVLTFLFAPAYAIRVNLINLPTNFLMMWVIFVWVFFIVWLLVKKQFPSYEASKKLIDKKIVTLLALFVLSGMMSLFITDLDRATLGQFIVLFFQPISIFF